MLFRNSLIIGSILLCIGCAKPSVVAKPVASAPEAVKAKPAKKEVKIDVPKGWRAVEGEGFAYALPKALEEIKADGEGSPVFAAKTADNAFMFAFDFDKEIVTVRRHLDQVLETLHEMDAEVLHVKTIEIDEHDGVAVVATHGEGAYVILAFVKDRAGYQITCGTPDQNDGQKMVTLCLAIADTFKFAK